MTSTPTPDQTAPPETVMLESVYEVTHSPTIGKLVLALAKAQLQYKAVLKQNENAAFTRGERKSFYADLATYIDATQEALAKEELVVLQWPDVSVDAKSMTLVSILAHSSGEWMRGRLTLPALGRDGFTAQSCGSSITYARRYSYAAITGCAAEDDDANSASGRGSTEAAQAVGQAKIAEHQRKAGKSPANASSVVPTLFYTRLENGAFELVNVKEYGSTLNEVAAEGLRLTLKKYVQSVNGDLIVPKDRFEGLEQELTDCKVPFKEVASADHS